jgi:hypothetical protein
VNVPTAGLNMVVPAGTDCIIVTFNANMRASVDTGCRLQALINGVPMNPQTANRGAVYNEAFGQAVTYIWGQSVAVSTQTTFLVQIQMYRTGGDPGGMTCIIDDWVLVVERRN